MDHKKGPSNPSPEILLDVIQGSKVHPEISLETAITTVLWT